MAIKIPRGELPTPSVGGNTNMMDLATIGSRSSSSSLSSLASTLFELDKVNKAHNAKVRNQEITNKNTENKSLLEGEAGDFIFNLQENKKLNTEGDYQKSFSKWENDTYNKYKKLYENEPDDEAWNRFKSDMYSVFNTAKKNMRDTRNKKILAQAEVNHDKGTQDFKKSIDNLPVNENIFLAKDVLLKKENERQVNVGQTLGSDKVTYAEQEKYANEKIWKKIISSDKKYQSDMDGETYTNYQLVIKELKTQKDKKYFGQSLDDETRQTLLDWAEIEMKDQETYFTSRDARMDVDNSKNINKDMDNWINGQGTFNLDGKEVTAEVYFNKTIPTLKITQKQKEALYKQVKTIAENKSKGVGTDAYGDPRALNEYYDKILMGQSKDSQFVLNLMQDERMTGKGKEWILTASKKWNDDLDEFQKNSLTGFIQPFKKDLKDLGAKIADYDDRTKTLYQNIERQVYLVTQKLLAEGEKSGISYNSMLNDINSPYYIGFKIQEIYNLGINEIQTAQRQENFNLQKFWTDKQNQVLSYFVDADPDTEGYQLYKGFEAGADINQEGFMAGEVKLKPMGDAAKFFERRLKKPNPPSYKRADNTTIPIGEYETSPEYQNYLKAYRKWLDEGGFNSTQIPSIMKSTLGFTDLIKVK